MKTTKIREEIKDYIHEADDRFIQMVYAMMKVNQEDKDFNRRRESRN